MGIVQYSALIVQSMLGRRRPREGNRQKVGDKKQKQKNLHPRKWRDLVLMVLGVTLVSTASHVSGEQGEEDHKAINMQYVLGVAAALAQVMIVPCQVYDERALYSLFL